jgi:hypothetical protein
MLNYYSDTIALPDSTINVKQAQFGVAQSSTQLSEGIMGLGWGNNHNLKYNNFVDVLAVQNVTNSRAFSVALGSANYNNGGILIFGGVDTKKFSGNLVSNPILGKQNGEDIDRYWIQMTGVSLTTSTSTTTYQGGNIPIVIDSGSSLSYLPEQVADALAGDLNGTFNSKGGYYLVDCTFGNSNATVDFAFGAATIRIPLSDFIIQAGVGFCILGAVPIDTTSAVTPLLGDTFMRSAVVVFDQTTKTISLAQYANCGENERDIPASGVGNLAGECAPGQIISNVNRSAASRTTYGHAGLVLLASLTTAFTMLL